jgi:hypothetical protein
MGNGSKMEFKELILGKMQYLKESRTGAEKDFIDAAQVNLKRALQNHRNMNPDAKGLPSYHPITGRKIYITGLTREPDKTAKADFQINYVHEDGSAASLHISHKKSPKASDYQGFGRIGYLPDSHPVKKKILSSMIEHGISPGNHGTLAYQLDRSNPEEELMIHKAMFGVNYDPESPKPYSKNNIHAVVGGRVHFSLAEDSGNDPYYKIGVQGAVLNRNNGQTQVPTGHFSVFIKSGGLGRKYSENSLAGLDARVGPDDQTPNAKVLNPREE